MANITNAHTSPLAVGGVTIAPGRTAAVADWDKLKGNSTIATWLKLGILKEEGATPSKTSNSGGTGGTSTPAYEAKHRGGGSYSIMAGDNEIVTGLKKDEADAFNALSDEDKAKDVERRKAE